MNMVHTATAEWMYIHRLAGTNFIRDKHETRWTRQEKGLYAYTLRKIIEYSLIWI